MEIGDVAFITENRKPVRIQALSYYREVVRRKELRVNAFETVERVTKQEDGRFLVETSKDRYLTPFCIIATGYYDHPNYMNIPVKGFLRYFITLKKAILILIKMLL